MISATSRFACKVRFLYERRGGDFSADDQRQYSLEDGQPQPDSVDRRNQHGAVDLHDPGRREQRVVYRHEVDAVCHLRRRKIAP